MNALLPICKMYIISCFLNYNLNKHTKIQMERPHNSYLIWTKIRLKRIILARTNHLCVSVLPRSALHVFFSVNSTLSNYTWIKLIAWGRRKPKERQPWLPQLLSLNSFATSSTDLEYFCSSSPHITTLYKISSRRELRQYCD